MGALGRPCDSPPCSRYPRYPRYRGQPVLAVCPIGGHCDPGSKSRFSRVAVVTFWCSKGFLMVSRSGFTVGFHDPLPARLRLRAGRPVLFQGTQRTIKGGVAAGNKQDPESGRYPANASGPGGEPGRGRSGDFRHPIVSPPHRPRTPSRAWPGATVPQLRRHDARPHGYARIWADMHGYGRIWADMGDARRELRSAGLVR